MRRDIIRKIISIYVTRNMLINVFRNISHLISSIEKHCPVYDESFSVIIVEQ